MKTNKSSSKQAFQAKKQGKKQAKPPGEQIKLYTKTYQSQSQEEIDRKNKENKEKTNKIMKNKNMCKI